MAAVVTSIEPEAGAVVLTWVAPADNSAAITKYKIEIQDRAGSAWHEEPTGLCDGSSPAVQAARECTIPMARFTAVPFSLQRGDLIAVRASAFNANGWSPVSTTNTAGARVRTAPTRMNAPVRDPSSSDSQIVVTWEPLTAGADTGDATILSYGLEWREGGDPAATWTPLAGHTTQTLVTTFTVTSALTPGAAYEF
jgi:hypothetical protein